MSSGGKGGSQTIGYMYYLGLHMLFCHGPVDKVGPIYAGERVAYSGRVSYDGTVGPPPQPTFTPPSGWDLRMEMDSDDIDGTLSPWTDAQNVTNVTFAASGAIFADGYMDIGDFELSDQFSVIFVLTPNDAGEDKQLLFGKHTDDGGGNGGRDRFAIWWRRSTGELGTTFALNDDSEVSWITPTDTFSAGEDHEILIQVSTSGQGDPTPATSIAVYRNGEWVGSKTYDGAPLWEGRSWVIGADWDYGATLRGNEYNGQMRDFHIYDDEVKNISDVWPVVSTSGSTEQQIYVNSPELFGGKKKEGGIQGHVDVCFGDENQLQNTYLLTQSGMTATTLPAFRGVVSLIARQCYVCAMSPYPKPWWVTIENIPGKSWYPSKAEINSDSDGTSANAAHIVREAIINTDWGMGYTTSDIDETEFQACADTLYDEGFGLSMMMSSQGSVEDFIQEVLKHVNGVLYSDRETGLFVMKLVRDDYSIGSLPVFDENNIIAVNSFQRPTFAEMINEVTLIYRKRGDIQESSITLQDLASVEAQGGVVSQTFNFIGIDDADIASRVAMRELKQNSTPLAQAQITVNRDGWNVNPGDPIVFEWAEYGIEQMVLRVVKINYGGVLRNRIIFDCVEDVFGLPDAAYVTPQDNLWDDPVGDPVAITESLIQEATYYELATGLPMAGTYVEDLDPSSAFLTYMAKPTAVASSGFELWTYVSGGYTQKTIGTYTTVGALATSVGYEDTSFQLTNLGFGADDIEIGSYAFIDDEIVRIDGIDLDNNIVTVGRGCIDTVPEQHDLYAEIWFGKDNWALDYTEYAQGNHVNIKALPITGLGTLAIGDATAEAIDMEGRAYKPYPVAKVAFQSATNYYPLFVYGSSATTAYFANRNRLQQTVVGSITDWFDDNISPEVGLTYTFRWFGELDIAALFADASRIDTGITGTSHSWSNADEITDSGVGEYSPPDGWDLHMPLSSNGIGGALSPWTSAQNVTDVTFSDRATFTGGYMDIGDFSLTTAAFSIAFIFTPVDTGDDYQLLIGKHTDDGTGGQDIFSVYWRRSTNQIYLGYGTTLAAVGSAGDIRPERKHELLITRSSTTVTVYLSGKQLGQVNFSISSWTGRSWVLGADWDASDSTRNDLFQGDMWDLRIWDNDVKTAADLWPTDRINRYFRLAITAVRDSTDSLQDYDFIVDDRGGWTLDWGNNFNGRNS